MEKKLLGVAAVFILANLAFLNYLAFTKADNFSAMKTTAPTSPFEKGDQVAIDTPCTKDCVDEIYAAIATLSAETTTVAATESTDGKAEYFIPFGSGSVPGGSTWQNVPGLQTYVDTSQYENISQVLFEVSVFIPTANQTANVQVFNVTAGHPVWNSNVFFSGGATPQFLISAPITLDPGNNLYQVQMQTQLEYPANITQARFHITTD